MALILFGNSFVALKLLEVQGFHFEALLLPELRYNPAEIQLRHPELFPIINAAS
jgi:hypothetical protein